LTGPEVKAIKTGGLNFKGAYVSLTSDHEALLVKAYIAPYKPASMIQRDYDPYHSRQLLLHRRELKYLLGKSSEPGLIILPLEIFLAHGLIKLKIAVARGKKKYDKRETIKKRDFERRKKQLVA
jgi:SsrA-binding protein